LIEGQTFPVAEPGRIGPFPASEAGMPRNLRLSVAAFLVVAMCALSGATAAAAPGRACNSADLRYAFQPGGPKTFGVFELRIAGGPCATAHRVAAAWMKRFETAFRAGRTVVPRSVAGFRFTTLASHQVQAFRERGQSGATTIWFDYRIPNG
jgi:hypothetical protein